MGVILRGYYVTTWLLLLASKLSVLLEPRARARNGSPYFVLWPYLVGSKANSMPVMEMEP